MSKQHRLTRVSCWCGALSFLVEKEGGKELMLEAYLGCPHTTLSEHWDRRVVSRSSESSKQPQESYLPLDPVFNMLRFPPRTK